MNERMVRESPVEAVEEVRMPNAGKVFGNSGRFSLAATDFEHPQAEGYSRDRQW
jgi:hypothetical protein